MADFTFKKGETIAYALTAVEGDATGWTVSCKMRALDSNGQPTGAVIATATVEFNAGGAGVDPFWTCTFSATDTSGVAVGDYGVDEKFSKAGVVQYTDTATVEIVEPVTA